MDTELRKYKIKEICKGFVYNDTTTNQKKP